MRVLATDANNVYRPAIFEVKDDESMANIRRQAFFIMVGVQISNVDSKLAVAIINSITVEKLTPLWKP